MSLDELVRAAQAGEPAAISELALRFRPMAVAVASRLVQPAIAEDVAHDALVEVLGSLGEVRQPFAFPLLVRLAVRKQADRTRRIRDPRPFVEDADESADPAVLAERRDLVMIVRAALQSASEPDRHLLRLRYLAEWSIADLAAATGLTEGAVRERLHDARRRLLPTLAASDLRPTPRRRPMPDSTEYLGHLYLADGTAVDESMEAIADDPPLLVLATKPSARRQSTTALTVGIKVIDAFAPLTRGGRHDVVGPFGTGHLVLARELVARANRSRPTACVAVGSRHWHKGGFSNFHKFASTSNPEAARFVTIVGSTVEDAAPTFDRASNLANALAEHRDVILVVDDFVASHATSNLAAFETGTTADDRAVTLLHLDPYGEGFDAPTRASYDGRLALSLDLAARGLFPAIDPEASRSALLREDTPERARALSAKALLSTARELTEALAQGLTGDDNQRREWVDLSATFAEIDRLVGEHGAVDRRS